MKIFLTNVLGYDRLYFNNLKYKAILQKQKSYTCLQEKTILQTDVFTFDDLI